MSLAKAAATAFAHCLAAAPGLTRGNAESPEVKTPEACQAGAQDNGKIQAMMGRREQIQKMMEQQLAGEAGTAK